VYTFTLCWVMRRVQSDWYRGEGRGDWSNRTVV
jgi:hypothetical protein